MYFIFNTVFVIFYIFFIDLIDCNRDLIDRNRDLIDGNRDLLDRKALYQQRLNNYSNNYNFLRVSDNIYNCCTNI